YALLCCRSRSLFYCLCFFMRRRLPISTLFPYTTLFRSDPEELADPVPVARRTRRFGDGADREQPGQKSVPGRGPRDRRRPRRIRDRKSTRLNSSHVKISYAVFCLKKKKNTKSTLRTQAN